MIRPHPTMARARACTGAGAVARAKPRTKATGRAGSASNGATVSSPGAGYTGNLTIVPADLSQARRIRFAWQGRVLLGYFNLMLGEEGAGKEHLDQLGWPPPCHTGHVARRVLWHTQERVVRGRPAEAAGVTYGCHGWQLSTLDRSRCHQIEGTKKGAIIDVKEHAKDVHEAALYYDKPPWTG